MTYRKSHYCIDVKLEKAEGKYMLVHSYTGALDLVGEDLVAYLKKTKEFDKESFPFSDDIFEALTKRGYVTQKTFAEEREYVRRLATLLHKAQSKSSCFFGFLVSYDCNFRCAYCYENGISQYGQEWSKKRFSPETVDRAYAVMLEIEPDKSKHAERIMLYGGEPFLKENIDIVEYIINKGADLGYEFQAITNGHDLGFYKHILAQGVIKDLQITLDGAKKMHDARRYHFMSGNSFDIIFENIGIALNNNVSVSVRFNADADNITEVDKLREMFIEAGYYQNERFSFYTALLKDYKDNSSKDVETSIDRDCDVPYLSHDEFNKMQERAGITENCDHELCRRLTNAISNGAYLMLNSTFCGAQANMHIFDPYGNIYNCLEVVGKGKHIAGRYYDKLEFGKERRRWNDRNIGNIDRCSACKYGLFCGGGCLAVALLEKEDFDKSHCDNFEYTFKLSANVAFEKWLEREQKNKANEHIVQI